MPSASTRAQLVTRALAMGGRGNEIRPLAVDLLNDLLREWALTYRFPALRKVGTPITLPAGMTTAPLPIDFGTGMEKQGLLFGVENTPLNEKSFEEFAQLVGFPPQSTGNGRPAFYCVDTNALVFRFNSPADQAYPFIPIYYSVPANIPTDQTGDNQTVWVSNDSLVVEGLVHKIYQFKEDMREDNQFIKVYGTERTPGLLQKWQRMLPTMGGTSRLMPSPERFKKVTF